MAAEMHSELTKVQSFVMFNYNKMSAQQAYSLRKFLHAQKIRVRIVKNTIAAVTFSELYNSSMENLLAGPTAIAYGGESPADIAKFLLEWNKKEKVIEIKGGLLDKRPLDKKEVESLAKFPPKPILVSMLAGAFKSPLNRVVTMVSAPVRDLAFAFRALIERKEKEGAA